MFGFSLEFIVFFVLAPLFLFCYALSDLTRREFPDSVSKLIWGLVILFIPLLGPLLYLSIGKRQGQRRVAAPPSKRATVLGLSVPDFIVYFLFPALLLVVAIGDFAGGHVSDGATKVLWALVIVAIRVIVPILRGARQSPRASRKPTTAPHAPKDRR